MASTDPDGAAPAAGDPPDAGPLEPVEGTGTGLRRELGRMPDGRRITYYWSRREVEPPAARAEQQQARP